MFFPILFQTLDTYRQGVAMRWISGYLDCLNAGGTSTISIKHPRVEFHIERAIENLYLQRDDPTNGAFNRRNANQSGDSIELPILVSVDAIDGDTSQLYYRDGEADTVGDCNNYQLGVPDTIQYIDILRSCYNPSNSTLVTPVLGVDINSANDPIAFFWLGIAYQIESGTPFLRYNYDICLDGNKCR